MERNMILHKLRLGNRSSDEEGMTLVETMVAMMVLVFGLLMLAQFLTFHVIESKTHGRNATKATAAAQDKMDELNTFVFADPQLTAGGSLPPSPPMPGYSDYLDDSGMPTAAGNAAYSRQWQILDTAANLKQINVSVTSNRNLSLSTPPSTTVVTLKTRQQ